MNERKEMIFDLIGINCSEGLNCEEQKQANGNREYVISLSKGDVAHQAVLQREELDESTLSNVSKNGLEESIKASGADFLEKLDAPFESVLEVSKADMGDAREVWLYTSYFLKNGFLYYCQSAVEGSGKDAIREEKDFHRMIVRSLEGVKEPEQISISGVAAATKNSFAAKIKTSQESHITTEEVIKPVKREDFEERADEESELLRKTGSEKKEGPRCPDCGAEMEEGKSVCSVCGFDITGGDDTRSEQTPGSIKNKEQTEEEKEEPDEKQTQNRISEKEAKASSKRTNKSIAMVLVSVVLIVFFGCIATNTVCIFHKWTEATCTAPRTCTKCGKTEGEALGHSIAKATCTQPSTCTVCGGKFGEAIGHNFTEATLEQPATCLSCGETKGKPNILCPECNGKKTVVCTNCDEAGLMICSHCNGGGEENCSKCDGKGHPECSKCDGSGKIKETVKCTMCGGYGCFWSDCSECGGWGKTYYGTGVLKEFRTCMGCNGKGKVKAMDCRFCNGTRMREEDVNCKYCDGTGLSDKNCSSCDATGKSVCSNCNGELKVKCDECDGSREVVCATCQGAGEVGQELDHQVKTGPIAETDPEPETEELVETTAAEVQSESVEPVTEKETIKETVAPETSPTAPETKQAVETVPANGEGDYIAHTIWYGTYFMVNGVRIRMERWIDSSGTHYYKEGDRITESIDGMHWEGPGRPFLWQELGNGNYMMICEGWVKDPVTGKFYYYHDPYNCSGELLKDSITPDGHYVDENGACTDGEPSNYIVSANSIEPYLGN